MKNHKCYYFDDIITFEDFYFDNILLDKKSCKNILIDDILYKTLISAKTLGLRFNKIDGFITVFDASRYLVLFSPEKYDATYDRIRYLIGLESDITEVLFSQLCKNQIWSLWFLASRKNVDFT